MTHPGKILSVSNGQVKVQIRSVSACASCEAHSRCGFAESKDKTLLIDTPDWQQWHEGDEVLVHINQRNALLAVLIAYILPALLLLAVIITLSLAQLPEPLVILAAFLSLALYILLLILRRRKLNNKFTLTITHKNNS